MIVYEVPYGPGAADAIERLVRTFREQLAVSVKKHAHQMGHEKVTVADVREYGFWITDSSDFVVNDVENLK